MKPFPFNYKFIPFQFYVSLMFHGVRNPLRRESVRSSPSDQFLGSSSALPLNYVVNGAAAESCRGRIRMRIIK